MGIKGYKAFNPDWTCRGFKYEVGKTYKIDGDIEICKEGFHFCQKVSDCFNYYSFNCENKVAEVEATGIVETEGNKSVTNEIKIVREISWQEVLVLVNTGNRNTGNRNTGDCNTGDYNTGNRNTGDCNTGNWNTGNWNTGNRNTGNRNTGDCNTGNRNTGDCNTGNWNTGDWNTGDYNTGNRNTGDWNLSDDNTGFFMTTKPVIYMFNKPTEYTDPKDIRALPGMDVLSRGFENSWWINSDNMTDEEKMKKPEHKTIGGYLKVVDFKTACKTMWGKFNDKEKQAVRELPNFDHDIFMKITGIDSDK